MTVVAHSPSGDVVDMSVADPTGRAEVGIEADSLVSTIFPGEITTSTKEISVVTTAPPSDGSELTIHGPFHNSTPPLIVGVLQLDGPNLNTATYFNVRLGCVTVRVAQLPATIDVAGCNMGSDQNLDVLVRGYHDVAGTPQLDGYGAGRVMMTNGVATFSVPSWLSSGPAVAVTLTGIQPTLAWTMHVDGLEFLSEPVGAYAYTGLVVDQTSIEATIPAAHGARITTRTVAGTPSTITLADSDFLPALESVPAAPTVTPTTIEWAAAGTGGDALHVHATWTVAVKVSSVVPPGPHLVVWDAIVPPDATSVTLPRLDGDLQTTIAPSGIAPSDLVLRAIDSSALDGLAALVAAGIHAEETMQPAAIVEPPLDGEVRVTQSVGAAQ